MRKPVIEETDYIDLQRLTDEINRFAKIYRYRHRKTYYDGHTEWPESVNSLRNIVYMQREGFIECVELLEEVEE